jgi:hypothetical protein
MALTPAKAGAGMTVYNRQSGGANDLFTYEILGEGKVIDVLTLHFELG